MLYFALLRFVRKESDKYKENLMNRGQVFEDCFCVSSAKYLPGGNTKPH